MAVTQEQLQLAEFQRLRFAVTLPAGDTLEDAMKQDYWKHCATKLKPKSIIEVVPEDGSFYAELFVTASDTTWARTALIMAVTFNESAAKQASKATKALKATPVDEGDEHYVDWGGNTAKGRVIRRADKQVVKDGFPSKADAIAWMLDHEAKNAQSTADGKEAQNLIDGE